MREIKFRAWTGSEMITPPNDTIGCGSGAEIIEISLAGFVSKRNAYGLDMFGSKNPSFDEPEKDIVLMQYTGLKDCNGKEIYENDVVIYMHNKMNHFVKYKGNGFVLTDSRDNIFVYNFNPIALDVIGNIYQNPELI